MHFAKGLELSDQMGVTLTFRLQECLWVYCSISCTSSLLSLESMYVCIHVVSFHDQNMPYILLACNTCLQVHSSEDYLGWLQTMYVLFGTKWSKLFCGPLQSVESTEQESSVATGAFNPLQYVTLET